MSVPYFKNGKKHDSKPGATQALLHINLIDSLHRIIFQITSKRRSDFIEKVYNVHMSKFFQRSIGWSLQTNTFTLYFASESVISRVPHVLAQRQIDRALLH